MGTTFILERAAGNWLASSKARRSPAGLFQPGSETGHVAAYGGWRFGALNLRAGGAYAFHAIDTDRTIAFPGFFDRATADIAARLRRGERLAAAMRSASCFPQDVVQPVAVAEESGALDTMLLDVASLADRQVDEKIGTLSSLCEPLVIVVLGALVGGLVIAMYLPIIQLGNVV